MEVAGEEAVVVGGIAKEDEKAGHVGLRSGAVVEHLQIAAIGVDIGRAAAELVVELVGTHYIHAQLVAVAVQLCQALSLLGQFARGRHDDDHVGIRVGVTLLRSYVAYDGRLGKHCGAQCRHGRGLLETQFDIVEAHIGA